jgi:hypothetical protein
MLQIQFLSVGGKAKGHIDEVRFQKRSKMEFQTVMQKRERRFSFRGVPSAIL